MSGVDNRYHQMAKEIGDLLVRKNASYGNSFVNAAKILAILYPDGVQPTQYRDMLCIVRILDKLGRIATDKDAFGEDPWVDCAGYSILMASLRRVKPER